MSPISSTDIQTLLDAGRLVEAGTLLTMHGEEMEPEERQALESQQQQLWTQATTSVAEGEALEQEGKNLEAQECYQRVSGFASDFPGIQDHCKRVTEALDLANAVRLRSKRIRAQAVQTSATGKTRAFGALIGTVVFLGFGSGIWWSMGHPGFNALPLRSATTVPITAKTAPVTPLPAAPVKVSMPTPVPTSKQPVLHADQAKPQPAQPPHELTAIAPPSNPVKPAPVAAVGPQADTPPTVISTEKKPEPATLPVTKTPSSPAPIAVDTPVMTAQQSLPVTEPEHPLLTTTAQFPPVEENPSAQAQEKMYTVQPGDSLSKIAERLFCNQDAWRQMHTLNHNQIKNPDLLVSGMQIRLTGVKNHCANKP
ncbi:MAG: LysM peptidoglycan-binding domain-containing protein [Desulfobulbus sp.]|nr:LysM peptidoglycan-binding domain-containing protein [Desulfobulbus sp.]